MHCLVIGMITEKSIYFLSSKINKNILLILIVQINCVEKDRIDM